MIKNVLEFIENSAKSQPDKVAFVDENKSVSYKGLESHCKSIGTYLTKFNTKNKPIAVLLDKGVNCLEAMFGVVYSGNFYVIIDSNMPVERVKTIFNTLSPIGVITDEQHMQKFDEFKNHCEIIDFETAVRADVDKEKLKQIRGQAIDTDPLYALFTSGSTGVPKGAVICHRSVIDYAHWVTTTFDIDDKTVFGNQTPFYFSMSVLDIFTTIKNAATLQIIPQSMFSFPLKLFEYINEKDINTIYWVPSALSIVANWKTFEYAQVPKIKTVLFAGEVMPTKQLNIWIKNNPNALFANLYGPTEITDICTYYIVNREFSQDESLPIGKPCDNCDIIVINKDGKQAKADEEGELCIRGSFLALGYYNNPEKTSEVFVQNPLNICYPELIYKTGDLVRYNEYGELIYISRKDFQIKHMGYRIELGEIETAVNGIDGIISCACVYNKAKEKIVLIYQSKNLSDKDILTEVVGKLPKYMVPNKLVRLKQMPLNANGKIDRATLAKEYADLK